MASKRILLIDGEPEVVKTVEFLLGLRNFEVASATDGIEGLAMAKELRPDLILLDINLPNMNGYEVCASLKRDFDTSRIPVLFLTSRDDTDSVTKAHRAGANDYIVKPFTTTIFFNKINKHLNTAKRRLAV